MKLQRVSIKNPRIIFITAALLPIPLESVGIFLYQHTNYWTDYSKVQAGLSAPGHFLYSNGPLAVLALGCVYILLLTLLMYFLPRILSIAVGLLFWGSHGLGFLSLLTYEILVAMNIHDKASAQMIEFIIFNLIGLIGCVLIAASLSKWFNADKQVSKRRSGK